MMFGGFLKGVPADVAESDHSQAGKGYRQKVVSAIYNETPRVITKRESSVGGLDESFSTALVEGRPFIQFDNLRGRLDSQMLESFFTSDYIAARIPHRGEIETSTRGFFIFVTSNGVETTKDFANRAAIFESESVLVTLIGSSRKVICCSM
jgi:hypothetical protein